jgi:phage terminase small subunit
MNIRNAPNHKGNKSNAQKKPLLEEIEDDELNDKQRLFCHYYLKSFNQTLAAIKAGYGPERAHITGSELVRNRKVAAEIRRLKGKMTEELFVDAMDVLEKYIKIAFSDITDYLTFGRREVQVMGPFGPLYEGKGKNKKPLMKTVNYIDFKESTQIDGTIISEVKQGKDGLSIKMADKMKAIEKLAEYFDLFPDKFKRQIEEERLKLDKLKVTGEGEGNGQEAIDEFIKATTMSENEIKAMFEGEYNE